MEQQPPVFPEADETAARVASGEPARASIMHAASEIVAKTLEEADPALRAGLVDTLREELLPVGVAVTEIDPDDAITAGIPVQTSPPRAVGKFTGRTREEVLIDLQKKGLRLRKRLRPVDSGDRPL